MGRTACTEPQCLYKGALYLYLYLYLQMIWIPYTFNQFRYLNKFYSDREFLT